MLRRLVSAQILLFRTVGFFLAVNQNTPKKLGYATSTNNRRSPMKQDWHPDELAQHWTLSAKERELLDSKTSATRLSFAVLLKAFRFDGRFPERREDIADRIVTYLASQTGVPPEAYSEGEWSERTQRYQRAQIRRHWFPSFSHRGRTRFRGVVERTSHISQPGGGGPQDRRVRAFALAEY
jgi:hypothetical protein